MATTSPNGVRTLVIWRALGFQLLLLGPALVAIWATPWFVTQDGPAHIYNAEILTRSFDHDSPFRDYFRIEWRPIPNWLGHLILAGLLRITPAWAADRLMTTITLVGFGMAIVWLRWRVRDDRGLYVAALLASLISMNLCWLFGFTNFMLGACLYPITLGVWWSRRDRLTRVRLCALAALLVIGFFCHLVVIGLTLFSLLVLATIAPFEGNAPAALKQRFVRVFKTSLSFLPVCLLVLEYRRISRQGGPMQPSWDHLAAVLSLQAWIGQLTWSDPLTIAVKYGLPFTQNTGKGFFLFAPVIWFLAAILTWLVAELSILIKRQRAHRSHHCLNPAAAALAAANPEPIEGNPDASPRGGGRWVWLILTGILLVMGVAGPDSLGPNHGYYLVQRIVLLSLVPFTCLFDINQKTPWGRAAVGLLAIAFMLQTALVWDYALASNRSAGQLLTARAAVGNGQRVFTLLIDTPTRFRANPMLHADLWLGVGTGNICWDNYETRHYYFPVQFVEPLKRPDHEEISALSNSQGDDRRKLWASMLARDADAIDVLLVWQHDAGLDEITERYFDCVQDRGELRIYRRKI
jgi:hypothetical protein